MTFAHYGALEMVRRKKYESAGRPKSAVNNTITESQVQKMVFEWAEVCGKPELKMLNASLNGVRITSPAGQINAKRQGMKAGFPDISLPVPKGKYHGLYIELKREKGGVLSPEQRGWLEALSRYGYQTAVCKGFDETIACIMRYIELGPFLVEKYCEVRCTTIW